MKICPECHANNLDIWTECHRCRAPLPESPGHPGQDAGSSCDSQFTEDPMTLEIEGAARDVPDDANFLDKPANQLDSVAGILGYQASVYDIPLHAKISLGALLFVMYTTCHNWPAVKAFVTRQPMSGSYMDYTSGYSGHVFDMSYQAGFEMWTASALLFLLACAISAAYCLGWFHKLGPAPRQ